MKDSIFVTQMQSSASCNERNTNQQGEYFVPINLTQVKIIDNIHCNEAAGKHILSCMMVKI